MQFKGLLSDVYAFLTTPPRQVGIPEVLIAALVSTIALPLTLSLPAAHLHPVNSFFLAAVAYSSWRGGWRIGVLALVLTAMESGVWVLPPVGTLNIYGAGFVSRFLTYLGEAGVATVVFARLRRWRQRNVALLSEARQARERTEKSLDRLRESEERLSLMIQSAQIGTWDWLLEPDNIIWCPRCAELYGLPPEKSMSFPVLLDAIHPDDRQRIRNTVTEALRQHGEYNAEMRTIWPDGSVHWIASIGRAYYDSRGKPVRMSGATMDITERKQTMEALVRSEKLASMGRMAATIAHEINNPLAAVMNSLYIARSSPGLPEHAEHHLKVADEELRRVAHITRRALGFYRESSSPSWISVTEVLDSAVDLLKNRIKGKHAEIRKQYGEVPEVLVAAGELRQVVANLLSNSLDAIDEHGTIILRTSFCSVNRGHLMVRMTVADNGPGIAPTVRSQVFEPLFTTKENLGTGLGLWVSKQLVQKYGGSIRMHSSVDGARRGTTFSILLPTDGAERGETLQAEPSLRRTA